MKSNRKFQMSTEECFAPASNDWNFVRPAAAAVVGIVASLAPFLASAAVDGAVATGITSLEADAATLGGLATGAVVAVMLIVLGIRLVKRMLGKAV